MRKPNVRRILLPMGLLSLSVVFFVGMLELGLRAFSPQIFEVHPNGLWQLSPTLGCRLTPGFDGVHLYADFRVRVKISKQGMRDREYGPKIPGTFRMLALGDSFTFGFGVEAEEAYPKQLEQMLHTHRKKRRYEVINAGAPGYATNQELQLLKEVGPVFQPDLVLLGFYAWNDIRDNMRPPDRFTIVSGYLYEKAGYEGAVQARAQRPGRLPIPFKGALWAHSHAYRFLASRYRELLSRLDARKEPPEPDSESSASSTPAPSPVRGHAPTYAEETYARTRELLLETAETAEKLHTKMGLVLIPDIKQAQNPEGSWTESWEVLKSFAATHAIPVIDLAPAFVEAARSGQAETLWFRVNHHWKAAGHRLAAQYIYTELTRQKLIP